jgi:hypothetical protein
MATKSNASELTRLISQLRQERQHHLDSISEIDQTFKEFGITADGTRRATKGPQRTKTTKVAKAAKPARKGKRGGKRKVVAEDSTPVARKGTKRRKKAAAVKKTAPRAKKAAGAAGGGDKKPKSPWGSKFPTTGDELILAFVKDKGSATTEEIRNHWQTSGRKGKAENNLTNLVKSNQIKRSKLDGKPGSSYSIP